MLQGCPGTAASSDLYAKMGWTCVDAGEDGKGQQGRGRAMIFVKTPQDGATVEGLPAEMRDGEFLNQMSDRAFVIQEGTKPARL